jgi:hypothetical protein
MTCCIHKTANLVCLINKITWIAHVVGDHRRLGLQSRLECLRAEWPRLVIDREGSVGGAREARAHCILSCSTGRTAVPEAPQPTRRTKQPPQPRLEFHGPKGALMMGALMWSRSQRRVCIDIDDAGPPVHGAIGVLPNHSSNPCSSAYKAAPARLDTPIFA